MTRGKIKKERRNNRKERIKKGGYKRKKKRNNKKEGGNVPLGLMRVVIVPGGKREVVRHWGVKGACCWGYTVARRFGWGVKGGWWGGRRERGRAG
jgi:hypothetical protein